MDYETTNHAAAEGYEVADQRIMTDGGTDVIPEEVRISEDIVDQYRDSAKSNMTVNEFGASAYDQANMGADLSDAIGQARNYEGDFDVVASIAFGFGVAYGDEGDMMAQDAPGQPDYEGMAQDIAEEASRRGLGHSKVSERLDDVEGMLNEGATNSEVVLDTLE